MLYLHVERAFPRHVSQTLARLQAEASDSLQAFLKGPESTLSCTYFYHLPCQSSQQVALHATLSLHVLRVSGGGV